MYWLVLLGLLAVHDVTLGQKVMETVDIAVEEVTPSRVKREVRTPPPTVANDGTLDGTLPGLQVIAVDGTVEAALKVRTAVVLRKVRPPPPPLDGQSGDDFAVAPARLRRSVLNGGDAGDQCSPIPREKVEATDLVLKVITHDSALLDAATPWALDLSAIQVSPPGGIEICGPAKILVITDVLHTLKDSDYSNNVFSKMVDVDCQADLPRGASILRVPFVSDTSFIVTSMRRQITNSRGVMKNVTNSSISMVHFMAGAPVFQKINTKHRALDLAVKTNILLKTKSPRNYASLTTTMKDNNKLLTDISAALATAESMTAVINVDKCLTSLKNATAAVESFISKAVGLQEGGFRGLVKPTDAILTKMCQRFDPEACDRLQCQRVKDREWFSSLEEGMFDWPSYLPSFLESSTLKRSLPRMMTPHRLLQMVEMKTSLPTFSRLLEAWARKKMQPTTLARTQPDPQDIMLRDPEISNEIFSKLLPKKQCGRPMETMHDDDLYIERDGGLLGDDLITLEPASSLEDEPTGNCTLAATSPPSYVGPRYLKVQNGMLLVGLPDWENLAGAAASATGVSWNEIGRVGCNQCMASLRNGDDGASRPV